MACDLSTLHSRACLSGIAKIENRITLLQVIAQNCVNWLASTSPEADVSLAAIQIRACDSGIAKMDNPVELLSIITQNFCTLTV